MAIRDESELMMRILYKEGFITEVMEVLGSEDFRAKILYGGRDVTETFLAQVEKWKVEWQKVQGFKKEEGV